MKRICFMIIALLLCFSMGAWADNIITMSSVEGAPGDEVTVNVSMTNTDVISSLQISIPLDENLSLVEGSGLLSSRCSDHSLTVGVKDGVLNVFVYSFSMAAISGTSGEVASFKLKLGNQPTTVALTPVTKLTSPSGAEISGSAQAGEVSTRCAKAQYSTMEVDFGEVPIRSTYQQTVTVTNVGNDVLTITDLNFSDVNVFSSTTALPLNVAVGASEELNITYAPVERGNINRTLKVECNSISKLNTIKLKAQPFAVNELHVQNASGISDEETTISMTMNNMDAISGFQIEFTLPEQLEYVANSFALSSRKQDHQIIASLTNNVLRIIAYSGNDKPFTGDDGEIGSFKVKLVGRYGTTLTPSKTVLSATINNHVENVVSAVYGGQVDILSPQIGCSNSLDFGAVSVTEECEQSFSIDNYGSAPLTISRIVFDNENLSIKEALPLVIPSGDTQAVTVVYSSVEQTTFGGTMNIYSNDPDQRMKAVTVSGSRFAPNYLEFSTSDIVSDENLNIVISANTYDEIAAIQFDIEYPSAYYETFENNYILEQRADGMTVQMLAVSDNTLRVFCYFLNGGCLTNGEGKIMTLLLKPKDKVVIPEGTYQISIKDIKLSTQQMINKYAGTDITSTFYVSTILWGDVNGDKTVNVTDVVTAIDFILMKNPSDFVFLTADVDKNQKINIVDVVSIIDIILGRWTPAPMHRAPEDKQYDQLQLIKNDDQSLSLCLNNQGQYIGAQFDLMLKNGQTLSQIIVNEERAPYHQISYSEIEPGLYRILLFTLENDVIEGQYGEITNFKIVGDVDGIRIENAQFVTVDRETKDFESVVFTTTGIRELKSAKLMDIYTIDGRIVRSQTTTTEGLRKGIYIIKNNRTIIK